MRWQIRTRFFPQQAQETSVQPRSLDEFSVNLLGRREVRFGCTLMHVAGRELLVTDIINSGRIWEWNQDKPDRAIRRGDVIKEVDGIRGDSDRMLKRIQGACHGVKLVVQPASCVHLDLESRAHLQFVLQGRDVSPDDAELLALLFDDTSPGAKDTEDSSHEIRAVVDALPRICASQCNVDECAVCLADFSPATLVIRLPCGHCYCPSCITSWLTLHQAHCPICLQSVVTETRDDATTSIRLPSLESHGMSNGEPETHTLENVSVASFARKPRRLYCREVTSIVTEACFAFDADVATNANAYEPDRIHSL